MDIIQALMSVVVVMTTVEVFVLLLIVCIMLWREMRQ